MSEWRKTRRKAEEALEMLHTFQTFSVWVNFPDSGMGWHYFGQLRLGILGQRSIPRRYSQRSQKSNFWTAAGWKKRKTGLPWTRWSCLPLPWVKFYLHTNVPGVATSVPWQVGSVFCSQEPSQGTVQNTPPQRFQLKGAGCSNQQLYRKNKTFWIPKPILSSSWDMKVSFGEHKGRWSTWEIISGSERGYSADTHFTLRNKTKSGNLFQISAL